MNINAVSREILYNNRMETTEKCQRIPEPRNKKIRFITRNHFFIDTDKDIEAEIARNAKLFNQTEIKRPINITQ